MASCERFPVFLSHDTGLQNVQRLIREKFEYQAEASSHRYVFLTVELDKINLITVLQPFKHHFYSLVWLRPVFWSWSNLERPPEKIFNTNLNLKNHLKYR